MDGYIIRGATFDPLIFGYCEEGKLMYAARARMASPPKVREELMKRFRRLETDNCPFVNMPEKKSRPLGRRPNCHQHGRLPVCRAGGGQERDTLYAGSVLRYKTEQ